MVGVGKIRKEKEKEKRERNESRCLTYTEVW